MKKEKKYIKIPKDYFNEMKYEVKVPTLICSCILGVCKGEQNQFNC